MSKETIRRALAVAQGPSPAHQATDPPPYAPGDVVYIIIPRLYTGPLDPSAPGIYPARFVGKGER